MLACLGGQRRLTNEAIDEAWADLQQLPAPWSGPSASRDLPSDIVEFGNLDDAEGDLPEAIPFRGGKSSAAPAAQTLHLAAPEEQLDSIADQLASIDEFHDGASTAQTEADLDFPEFGDPFGEQFDEEEVVLDRYRSGTELFAQLPRVSSWEGHQLGSLLTGQDAVQSPEDASPQLKVAQSTTAPTPLAGASAAPIYVTPVASDELPRPAAQPQSSPVVSLTNVTSDRDVIIVEDEPGTSVCLPVRPRHGEFRQLFSKLRRG